MTIENEKLYTVGQAARILGLDHPAGRRHVLRLIHKGKISAEDHGSGVKARWFIPASSLKAYLGYRRDNHQRTRWLN